MQVTTNKELEMQVDEESKVPHQSNLKSQKSIRIRMFNRLDSKMCMVTVLGYLLVWEQSEKFFRCLNKQGQAYFDTHKTQFRHFINDAPIARMAINFGAKSFQVIKPKRFARIEELEFGYITSDLYTIEAFA